MTSPEESNRGLVLVVDDDADIARFVALNLRLEGFEVVTAGDGYQALAHLARRRPDMVLLDVMMPMVDGVELTRQLRSDPMTASLPIILLTAKNLSADKIVGLTTGADDYIVKPFDTQELVARVHSVLRRHREIRELSPLTGLPGNARITREVTGWMRQGNEFALCYVDANHFKSVNDAYGFVRGDDFISTLASSLHRGVVGAGPPLAFLGHVGGDDFIILCVPEQVQAITQRAIMDFEERALSLYDERDRERGYVEVTDRQGNPVRAGFVTLSIGVAISSHRVFTDPREVVEVATEMKSVAKKHSGSFVAIDRRQTL